MFGFLFGAWFNFEVGGLGDADDGGQEREGARGGEWEVLEGGDVIGEGLLHLFEFALLDLEIDGSRQRVAGGSRLVGG